MSTDGFHALIDAYFAASRLTNPTEKIAGMVACFTPEAVCYDPADGPALVGQDDLRQFFQSIAGLFQDVGLTADFVAINGQEAAVKWTGTGTGHNGRVVTFEGIDLFEIAPDGKFRSMRAYWNPAATIALLQAT